MRPPRALHDGRLRPLGASTCFWNRTLTHLSSIHRTPPGNLGVERASVPHRHRSLRPGNNADTGACCSPEVGGQSTRTMFRTVRSVNLRPVSCPTLRLGSPRLHSGRAVLSANTSAFGNRCPALGRTPRLNIGQSICALLAPCRTGASAPSMRQPVSGQNTSPSGGWRSGSRPFPAVGHRPPGCLRPPGLLETGLTSGGQTLSCAPLGRHGRVELWKPNHRKRR
jgi:hypothetical protein